MWFDKERRKQTLSSHSRFILLFFFHCHLLTSFSFQLMLLFHCCGLESFTEPQSKRRNEKKMPSLTGAHTKGKIIIWKVHVGSKCCISPLSKHWLGRGLGSGPQKQPWSGRGKGLAGTRGRQRHQTGVLASARRMFHTSRGKPSPDRKSVV